MAEARTVSPTVLVVPSAKVVNGRRRALRQDGREADHVQGPEERGEGQEDERVLGPVQEQAALHVVPVAAIARAVSVRELLRERTASEARGWPARHPAWQAPGAGVLIRPYTHPTK